MSGTIGITAHHVPGVRAVRRAVTTRFLAVRARGGLSVPVAVPVAIAITVGATWAIVRFASGLETTLLVAPW